MLIAASNSLRNHSWGKSGYGIYLMAIIGSSLAYFLTVSIRLKGKKIIKGGKRYLGSKDESEDLE